MKNNVMSTVTLYKLYDFIHDNAEAVPDIIPILCFPTFSRHGKYVTSTDPMSLESYEQCSL